MNKLGNWGALGILAMSSLAACNLDRPGSDESGYFYQGYVYDGISNERLTDYSLSLSYAETNLDAMLLEDGMFMVGPLKPFSDYTITIDADDYRPFFASESLIVNFPAAQDRTQTQIFEAFLFPTGVESPELTFSIFTPEGNRPEGTIRVTPANDNGTSVISLDGAIAGSVAGQVWANDADRKFSTLVKSVEAGEVQFETGELVYGVTYTATLLSFDGQQFQSFDFTPGLADDTAVTLPRLTEQPLQIVANSLDTNNLSNNAEIMLTFNQEIELSPNISEAAVAEQIDDGFSINSPDADGDGDGNALTTDDETDAQENGTSLDIDGNMLALSWARDDDNFETMDASDPILSATYTITSITLRPAGGRADQAVPLSTLLNGATTLTIDVDPDQP